MRGLEFRVSLSDLRSWFAQPKAQLTEQPLTLPHLQLHAQFAAKKRRQSRSVPHLRGKAEPAGVGAQRGLHASHCSSFRRLGRPGRSPSDKPANPCASNRWTQFTTVRGESPNNSATCGHVMPWATSKTPCRR